MLFLQSVLRLQLLDLHALGGKLRLDGLDGAVDLLALDRRAVVQFVGDGFRGLHFDVGCEPLFAEFVFHVGVQLGGRVLGSDSGGGSLLVQLLVLEPRREVAVGGFRRLHLPLRVQSLELELRIAQDNQNCIRLNFSARAH